MAPTDEAVRAELRRIILSPGFVHSDRLRRFLTYSVEQTLAGNPQNLKEYAIGVESFDRPKNYSPSEDPIVRVEARRLRKKLDEYYAAAGASNPVRIELPKGSYVPTFIDCSPPPTAAAVSKTPSTFLAIAVLVLVGGAVVWLNWKRATPSSDPPILTRLTSDAGLTTDPALSSDGQWLAYATDRGSSNLNIWIRKVHGDARRLTTSAADHHQPALSPHGDTIAFRSEGEVAGIYTMTTSGEEPRLIAKEGRDPQYSPDGTRLAYWTGSPGDDMLAPAGRVFIVPSAANASPVSVLPESFASAACPAWSPDGGRVLFIGLADSKGHPDWWTAPARPGDTSPPTTTGAVEILTRSGLVLPFRECTASWQPTGLIFAARSGDTQNLWRLPLDSNGRAHPPLERLTFGSAAEWRPTSSASGTIAFSSRASHSRIWKMSSSTGELIPIATASSDASFPSASRNGHAVTFLAGSGLWWKDLESGREVALTEPPIQPRYPQISPDGMRVAFTDQSTNPHRTFVASPESRQLQPLAIPDGRIWDWTADLIIYQRRDGRHEFEEFDTRTSQSRTIVKAEFDLAGARLSSDLRTIAWHGIPSALRRQLFRAPYADTHSATPVLDQDAMDRNCAWSPDGRVLYFLSDRDGYRCIWKTAIGGNRVAEAVRHFHSAKQSLNGFGDVGAIGLSAVGNGLVFALSDSASDLWFLERRR